MKKLTGLSGLGGLVYSTDQGRTCPTCRQPAVQCQCHLAVQPVGDGVVRVRRETKGRGGKTVSVIQGVPLDALKLKSLAADLKRCCGSGGSLKADGIEIQGDHVDLLLTELQSRGFRVKRAGG